MRKSTKHHKTGELTRQQLQQVAGGNGQIIDKYNQTIVAPEQPVATSD